MSSPIPFRTSDPADDDLISEYPSDERAQRVNQGNWWGKEHFESTVQGDDLGRHTQISFPDAGGDPATIGTRSFLYAKLISTFVELFFKDNQGNVKQLTEEGLFTSLARLASATDAERTMLGELIIAAGVLLNNAQVVRGRNQADTASHDLLSFNASDQLVLGDQTNDSVQQLLLQVAANVTDAKDQFVVDYGLGPQKLQHLGNGGAGTGFDTDKVHGVDGADVLVLDSSSPNYFDSGLQTVPSSGSKLDVAHGLASAPRLLAAELVCIDAAGDNGYVQNDKLPIGTDFSYVSNRGIAVYSDATHCHAINGDGDLRGINPSNGDEFDLDISRWNLRFHAWR